MRLGVGGGRRVLDCREQRPEVTQAWNVDFLPRPGAALKISERLYFSSVFQHLPPVHTDPFIKGSPSYILVCLFAHSLLGRLGILPIQKLFAFELRISSLN